MAIKCLSRSILKRKRVGRNGSAYDSVLGEIAIMKHLRHPNIVRLFEVIDDPDQDLLFMCMEVSTGGDLSASITQVPHGLISDGIASDCPWRSLTIAVVAVGPYGLA